MADIQAMNIQQEPGENIANMSAKIYQICKCISGMVRANKIPPDLPEICMWVFLSTKTTTFNVVMTNILLYVQTKTATWNKVIRQATNKYNALTKGKNCEWLALHEHKEDPMIKARQVQIKALQDKIKNLEGQLMQKKMEGGGSNDMDKHTNLTCRKCKKKGHITKDCPEKKEGCAKLEGDANKDKGKKTGPTLLYKIPPKDNEAHTRKLMTSSAHGATIANVGQRVRRNILAQHKTKEELKQGMQANLVAADLPAGGLFQFLHFM